MVQNASVEELPPEERDGFKRYQEHNMRTGSRSLAAMAGKLLSDTPQLPETNVPRLPRGR
jgi:hypothetical protein